SVNSWPSVLYLCVFDSVWMIPVTSCVCSGEMHTVLHGGLMPPYPVAPLPLGSSGNSCTPGLVVSMPSPAGTVTFWPFTNTSRWAWTWKVRRSAVSGTSPAARARAIGSGGAGHTMALGVVGVVVPLQLE